MAEIRSLEKKIESLTKSLNTEKDTVRTVTNERDKFKSRLDDLRAYRDKYREDHPEDVAASKEKHKESHPEDVRAYREKYKDEHPEKVTASRDKYTLRIHTCIWIFSTWMKIIKKLLTIEISQFQAFSQILEASSV